MKYPVWYQDKEGHFHRIPPGILETFADGQIGLTGHRKMQEGSDTEKFICGALASGMFRYEPYSDRLLYRESIYKRSDP